MEDRPYGALLYCFLYFCVSMPVGWRAIEIKVFEVRFCGLFWGDVFMMYVSAYR